MAGSHPDEPETGRAGVQISGLGVVSAIGHDVATFAQSLQAGRCGVRLHQPRQDQQALAPACALAARLEGFQLEAALGQLIRLPPALLEQAWHGARRATLAVQASLVTALQAWQQADLHCNAVPAERIGLVIAGHNTTQHHQYALEPGFRDNPHHLSPRYAMQFMDSHQIGVLSETLGIRGESMVCGGASASGNVGLIQGLRLIQLGLLDACLVVGVLADLSPMELQAFANIGALGGKRLHDAPELACRPFDAQHEGFIYGQASACVLLESRISARRRGKTGLGALLGGAIALHASASSAPDPAGEARAMQSALQHSNLRAEQIDYLNTHGSSSPLGDQVEIQAIEQVFGSHFSTLRLNATKGLTGHCLYAAGVVECIATLIQMQQDFIHPNRNLLQPIHAHARFAGAAAEPARIRLALSNSFGFGGINTSIVLQNLKHAA